MSVPSAIKKTANQSIEAGKFCFSPSTLSGKPIQDQVAITQAGKKDAIQKLKAFSEASGELTKQLGSNVKNTPVMDNDAGGSLGISSMAQSAAIGLGLAAINPVLGATYMAADAVKTGVNFATQSLSGAGGHAGLDHAAISGGTSTLSRSLFDEGKDSGPYVDVLGGVWGNDGYKLSETKTVKPAATGPSGPMASRAREAIDQLGEDQVRAELDNSYRSPIQQGLQQQITAADKYAQNILGITGPDMRADYAANQPVFKMTANAGPSFG